MNLKKLKKHEGTTISYKRLCAILDINALTSNSKKKQFDEFKKLFNFNDLKKAGIEIIKVYNGTEAVFTDTKVNRRNYSTLLFLDHILSEMKRLNSQSVYIDKEKLFLILALCNDTYIVRKDQVDSKVKIKNKAKTAIEKEHFEYSYDSQIRMLNNIINELHSDEVIIKEDIYFVAYNKSDKMKEANLKMCLAINEVKHDVCKEDEFKVFRDKNDKLVCPKVPAQLLKFKKLNNLFNSMVKEELKEKFGIMKYKKKIKISSTNRLIDISLKYTIEEIRSTNNDLCLDLIYKWIASNSIDSFQELLIPAKKEIANKYNKI